MAESKKSLFASPPATRIFWLSQQLFVQPCETGKAGPTGAPPTEWQIGLALIPKGSGGDEGATGRQTVLSRK